MGVYGGVLVLILGFVGAMTDDGEDPGYSKLLGCRQDQLHTEITVIQEPGAPTRRLPPDGLQVGAKKVVDPNRLSGCLTVIGQQVKTDVRNILSAGEHLKAPKGITIEDTAFGHGRYAAEYAALCGLYNLYDAAYNMDPPKELQTWSELVKPLEYLVISLAPDGWCNNSGDKTENVEKARLPDDGNGDNYTIEKCAERIKEIRDATTENREKASADAKERKAELKKVNGTELTFHPEVTNEKAKKRAYAKVLKLLLRAKGFQGGYEKAYKNATGTWESGIEGKLKGIFDENYAKSIGRIGAEPTATDLLPCSEKECPTIKDPDERPYLCQPNNKTKPTGIETWTEPKDMFRAGFNILVDMACLCIPATGTCTACTGTQPIKHWEEGANGIKDQIQTLIDGCKARNTYGRVTSETIKLALDNFDKLRGRWQSGDANGGYKLAEKSGDYGNGRKEPTNGYDSVLGMARNGKCTGDEYQHCVNYAKFNDGTSTPSVDENYQFEEPQWYVNVETAQNALKTLEQAYEQASAIRHKISLLTEVAVQAREEALFPPATPSQATPTQPTPPTQETPDFEKLLDGYCGSKNESQCQKVLICNWDGDSKKCKVAETVTVPVTVSGLSKEEQKAYAEKLSECAKYGKEDCESREGCTFVGSNCTASTQGLKAHIPIRTESAPFFIILPPLIFFIL